MTLKTDVTLKKEDVGFFCGWLEHSRSESRQDFRSIDVCPPKLLASLATLGESRYEKGHSTSAGCGRTPRCGSQLTRSTSPAISIVTRRERDGFFPDLPENSQFASDSEPQANLRALPIFIGIVSLRHLLNQPNPLLRCLFSYGF